MALAWLAVGLVFLWALAALSFVKGPSYPVRVAWVVALVAVPVVARWTGLEGVRFLGATLAGAALAGVVWWLFAPSNDRRWWEEQAVHPTGASDGERVTIQGFRVFRADDEPIRYEAHALDLAALERLWFGVETFPGWEGGAHTFLSFQVADGPFVSVSVESRREAGEAFDPVHGLFKAYELVYVIGDEREVVGRRGGLTGAPAYLYPIRTTAEGRQRLLLDIVRRSTELARQPEHYNTLTNNCTSNLAEHVHAIAPRTLPSYDLRTVFPGYADRLLYELDLIDTELPFEEARARFRIDGRVGGRIGDDFSWRVRDLPPPPS